MALPGKAENEICGVRPGMKAAEVGALLGPPTKQGPSRPMVYNDIPLPKIGWWLTYLKPGQNRQEGPPPLDVGLDQRAGRVVAVIGPNLQRKGDQESPPLWILRGNRCYHQYSDFGMQNCGYYQTAVRVHPVYVLLSGKQARLVTPKGPAVDSIPIGALLSSFLHGTTIQEGAHHYNLGHSGASFSTLKGRIVYAEGRRFQEKNQLLADVGWTKERVKSKLGSPVRILRRRGVALLLYPRYLARIVLVGNRVGAVQVGIEPYPEAEGKADFTPKEVRSSVYNPTVFN